MTLNGCSFMSFKIIITDDDKSVSESITIESHRVNSKLIITITGKK